MVTDEQVRRLMEEMSRHGRIGLGAMRSGMDRKTARRYVSSEKLPSEMRSKKRRGRTRPDPFADDWAQIESMLESAPDLEAKTIFEHLCSSDPDRYRPGQLRTLQRRVRQWRARNGPEKEVFFAQEHRAGEAMQTDFTSCNGLGIMIGGERLAHLLCHSVLPYSNWESVTVCVSESMEALKRGVQTALFRLGRVPSHHQTDHSTAATHRDLGASGGRDFNREYVAFCEHFGMKPRTTAVGAKEQNGDVEVSHRVLKRRLEQRLLLRGSREFPSVEAYEAWLSEDCRRANAGRNARASEEIAAMRPVPPNRFAEYTESEVRVTSQSTIRVKKNTYSVPSRLIGEKVRVRVHDRKIEVFHGGLLQLGADRLRGEASHRIDYRHVISSLVRKPGAFERYRYREDLFPDLVFRRAYDRLRDSLSAREADLNYLRVLHLSARNSEAAVKSALVEIAVEDGVPTIDAVKGRVVTEPVEIPAMAEIEVDLSPFDELLTERDPHDEFERDAAGEVQGEAG